LAPLNGVPRTVGGQDAVKYAHLTIVGKETLSDITQAHVPLRFRVCVWKFSGSGRIPFSGRILSSRVSSYSLFLGCVVGVSSVPSCSLSHVTRHPVTNVVYELLTSFNQSMSSPRFRDSPCAPGTSLFPLPVVCFTLVVVTTIRRQEYW
jgi:hypothetical protein